MQNDDITRRSVLRASGAAVGLGAVGSAAAVSGSDDPYAGAQRIPCLDVTDHMDDVEPVDAATVPPETVTGIGPGSMLFIERPDASGVSGCTANFVWRDAGGARYLGAAGHCFLPDGADAARSAGGSYDASGVTTRACLDCTFGGETALAGLRGRTVELGAVIYARQSQDGVDVGNDFGLVRIPSSVEHLVSPAMPTWGGPHETGVVDAGETLVQYGNGVATGETFATKSRTGVGVSNDTDGGRWTAELPAAPGDSGSAVQGAQVTASGPEGVEAAGVLTHLTTVGTAGTNVAKARRMAAQAGLDVGLVFA
jgi:hypothetical protein